MKLHRIAAASATVLIGTLALGGVAHAADAKADGPSHRQTIEAPAGTAHVDGKKDRPASKDKAYSRTVQAAPGTDHIDAEKVRPASKDNRYSQTVQAPAGTPHTKAARV
ncbi:hypothetical protein ACIRP0_28000 [Streptomyces sp. NPDC101733]|uniref:hypothetical protein n=1 Tax=unclassified Streptomyces TaxID=2593676 RepID=UPI0038025FAD